MELDNNLALLYISNNLDSLQWGSLTEREILITSIFHQHLFIFYLFKLLWGLKELFFTRYNRAWKWVIAVVWDYIMLYTPLSSRQDDPWAHPAMTIADFHKGIFWNLLYSYRYDIITKGDRLDRYIEREKFLFFIIDLWSMIQYPFRQCYVIAKSVYTLS